MAIVPQIGVFDNAGLAFGKCIGEIVFDLLGCSNADCARYEVRSFKPDRSGISMARKHSKHDPYGDLDREEDAPGCCQSNRNLFPNGGAFAR